MTDASRLATLAALGALLHDIGKFRQRAFWSERRTHQAHGKDWIEKAVLPRLKFLSAEERCRVAEMVEKHHEARPYERDILLVQLADRLASGERVARTEEGDTGDPSQELLQPVFADLRLDDRRLPESDRHRWVYRTAPLTLNEVIFPEEREKIRADYPGLWAAFEGAWRDLPDEAPAFHHLDVFILTWLSLLRAFCWCVPSAAYRDEPDISLADHLHVTGALTACLAYLGEDTLGRLERDPFVDEPVALLVGGDVSGIQRFLYTISSAGAAKSLRGRSAYLSLLCDATAEYVRRELKLLPCNVLYSSGGHFYLLAPLGAHERLRDLQGRVTELFLDFFEGDVSIVLESVELQGRDFRIAPDSVKSPLGRRWQELAERLREAKQVLLREVAFAKPERIFGPFGVGGPQPYCVICHVEPDQPQGLANRGLTRPVKIEAAEEAEHKCSLCQSFEELSRDIARAEYLVLRQVPPRATGQLRWHSVLTALGVELWLNEAADVAAHYRDRDWVLRVNNPSLQPINHPSRRIPVVGYRWLPNFTPREPDGSVREIRDMAHDSRGAPYYSALRMDVDSLGRIFSEGLGGRLSLSRLATLSRSLSTFFEGYVNRICEQTDPARQRLYLLYSGGDDLLAVGRWDAVLELAWRIHTEFARYACQNPAITVSGGTALHHEKFPLYQAAEVSGALLEAAKAWQRDGRTKDAFNVWGQPVGWADFEWLRRWHGTISGWLGEQQVSRALVFKLARIALMYEERRKELARPGDLTEADLRRRVRYDRWLWTLVYYLARERNELQPELARLREELVEKDRIDGLSLLARWVELSSR